MADNVYLLETRLSPTQQAAMTAVRDTARARGLTVFLVGGAVRDLISGSPVRDLDFAVQGSAMELRQDLEAAGGVFSGQMPERQALFLRFPGAVRVEVGATLSAAYPKPGKPVFQPTTILEDLRRRDFTANAMALSLNDGSYGLLMDPLNGVADIENRELRLVSNYGFIEDPVRMIRAARLMARQGWQLEERTRARYETGKEESYIDAMQAAEQAYELEEVFHEEDPLRVMRRLEEEGWLKLLSPSLGVAKANTAELGRLRDVQMQFQTRGVMADAAAANFPLLTAKLAPAEVEAIRASFPRAGFTGEIETLESAAKELVTRVVSKEMAAPSAAYRYMMEAAPATVVYAAYSSRNSAFQTKVKSFLTDWPTAQSRIPYTLMTEMRITPEVPRYAELIERLFYALMDGGLESAEELRAFLEPYSPPAPPPPVSLKRPRAARKEAKGGKGKKKAAGLAIAATEEESLTDREAEEPAEAAAEEAEPVEPSPAAKPSRPVKSVVVAVPAQDAVPAARPAGAAPVRSGGKSKAVAPATVTPAAPASELAAVPVPVQGRLAKSVPAKPVATKAAPAKAAAPKAPAVKSAAGKAPAAKNVGSKSAASIKPGHKMPGTKSAKTATKTPAKSAKASVPVKRAGATAKTAGKATPASKGKSATAAARPVRGGAVKALPKKSAVKRPAPRQAAAKKSVKPAAKSKARR